MKASSPSRCIGAELEYTGHHLWIGRWNLWKPSLRISSTRRTAWVYRTDTKLSCCTNSALFWFQSECMIPSPTCSFCGSRIQKQLKLRGSDSESLARRCWLGPRQSSDSLTGCRLFCQDDPLTWLLSKDISFLPAVLSSSPCEPLSRAVWVTSQHVNWLPLEKLILERARRKLQCL